jgi:UDP-GlcNAc:undecaprenyl-phosphate/decaprenyl-phosphate GlcNAc-1-phosphate transferase
MEKVIEIVTRILPLSPIVSAFVITYLAIPMVVKYANRHQLFDVPNERKEHTNPIPALGGISIVLGILPSLMGLAFNHPSTETLVFIAGMITLFVTGVVDDIMLVSAGKRLFIQLSIAAAVVFSGVRLPDLYGIAGIVYIPDYAMVILSIIMITGVVNAFNLIDGINGLAGGLGCISIFILGVLLFLNGYTYYAVVAFSSAISYLAFLRYNLKPTFIFMGDNGSLVLGFMIVFFSLKLLSIHRTTVLVDQDLVLKICFAISTIPVMDALREY